jgi:molybdenum cofactor cytidylyltransferase
MAVAAVLLAAGRGSRFTSSGGEGHKLLAPYRGRTVIEWAADHVTAADLDATYVVWGAVDLPLPPATWTTVRLVTNPRWREGIATSLQAGVAAASNDGYDAVVVGLGDQPGVPPEAWHRVAVAQATPIAVATYGGVRANPVRLSSSVWPLLPSSGDEGARAVMHHRPELVTDIPCPGVPGDIDTLDDLERMRLAGWC